MAASFLASSINISARALFPKPCSNWNYYRSMHNGSVRGFRMISTITTSGPRMISRLTTSNGSRTMSTLTASNNTNDDFLQPWMLLTPKSVYENEHKDDGSLTWKGDFFNFYSLTEKRVLNVPIKSGLESYPLYYFRTGLLQIVGSSHGWLAVFNSSNIWDLFLFNPLSGGGRRVQLPPFHTLPWPENDKPCVTKIILSCSPEDSECRAMMCYSANDRLAFCRPGHSKEWTAIGELYDEDGEEREYEDFVFSDKLGAFICTTREGGFEVWDLRQEDHPTMNKLEMEVDEGNYPFAYTSEKDLDFKKNKCEVSNFLVALEGCPGEFLLVRRYVYNQGILQGDDENRECSEHLENSYSRPPAFDVYRYDAEGKALRYLDHNNDNSLDGMALFVGVNHSFAMSTADHQQIRPNSIYFSSDGIHYDEGGNFVGHEIGIYNYQDRTFEPSNYPCDIPNRKTIRPKPIWFTPCSI